MKVRFWGTRGSIPTPGHKTLKYGGNTSCVQIQAGERLLICDSGTGIRELGLSLMGQAKGEPIKGDIFIGHTHWDHIQGFPFFVPAYLPKNRFQIHSVKSVGDSFENIFRRQMGINYFPVEVGDMASQLDFHHVDGTEFEAGPVKVKTMYTNHPGVNTAFRFEFEGSSVIYLTDHESHEAFSQGGDLAKKQDAQVAEFCKGASMLICDSQYNDEEYEIKRGWGHSRWKDTVKLAVQAEVERLALFHHEPVRSDEDLDRVEEEARAHAASLGGKFELFCAKEGEETPC